MVISLLYAYITKDWINYQWFSVSLNFFCFVALLPIRESPRFLYSMKKFKEAKDLFRFIAKINGKKYDPNYEFDTERMQMTLFEKSTLIAPIDINFSKD